jgi:hypothetical protein
MKTSTTMADGMKSRAMETCGHRLVFPGTGRLTAMVTGSMFLPGDGLGLKMSLGVLHRSITAVGPSYRAAGAGSPDRLQLLRFIRRHWLHSSAVEALASASVLEVEWGGFRWRQGKCSYHGIELARVTFRT